MDWWSWKADSFPSSFPRVSKGASRAAVSEPTELSCEAPPHCNATKLAKPGLDMVSEELEQLRSGQRRLQRMCAELQRDHLALCQLLCRSHALDIHKLNAEQHRRSFAAAIQRHPLSDPSSFLEAMDGSGAAVWVTQCLDPATVHALHATSRRSRQLMEEAIETRMSMFGPKIFVCGGINNHVDQVSTSSVECLKILSGGKVAWEPAPCMREGRELGSSVVVHGRIYVCGGRNGERSLSSVERFHPKSLSWEQMPSMSVARSGVSLAVCDDYLYAFGGETRVQYLNDAERLSMKSSTQEWEALPPMQCHRAQGTIAQLNGRLYIWAGNAGLQKLRSLESFDLASKTWESLPDTRQSRNLASAAMVGNQLYICGGQDRTQCTRSAERFSFGSSWGNLPPMYHERSASMTAVVRGNLYVIGGTGTCEYLQECECFKPADHAWERLPCMSVPRASAVLAVVTGQIYICGGRDGATYWTSTERYSPVSRRWTLLQDMTQARSNAFAMPVLQPLDMIGSFTERD